MKENYLTSVIVTIVAVSFIAYYVGKSSTIQSSPISETSTSSHKEITVNQNQSASITTQNGSRPAK